MTETSKKRWNDERRCLQETILAVKHMRAAEKAIRCTALDSEIEDLEEWASLLASESEKPRTAHDMLVRGGFQHLPYGYLCATDEVE